MLLKYHKKPYMLGFYYQRNNTFDGRCPVIDTQSNALAKI
jgi:hypothetical protein